MKTNKRTKIQLSDHFTYARLLRFVIPSIVMMIFTSIYGVVDGLFVSNYVGKTPFAAVNLIMPFLMIMGAIGFMFGTGGSAVVSQALGEGKRDKANEYFSMMVYVVIGCGIVLTLVGQLVLRPVSAAFGAEGEMIENCVIYGRIILLALTAFMLQNVFQSFLVTAERPKLGLGVTVAAGVANMVLDFVFIVIFQWGVVGAAAATAASQVIGGIVPLVYFFRPNTSLLRLVKTKINGTILRKTCLNGSSELMTNISASLITILYNRTLMDMAGAQGVAAYTAMMYVQFIFVAMLIGVSMGSAPIFSYQLGAGNHGELKSLLRKCLTIILAGSVVMTAAAMALAPALSYIFVGYDAQLLELTTRGFRIYSIAYLFCGASIFASSFFTALGDGGVSAAISFLRTLLFQAGAILLLPRVLDLDGVWLATALAELLAMAVSGWFLWSRREKYHYA